MKSRSRISARKVNHIFRKRSYVKKDNRRISLHRGGERLV